MKSPNISIIAKTAMADGLVPLIVMDNISLGYNSSAVLTDVNLAIYPGNLVGLAGPNGSGKTTLFRTMLSLLAPLSGTLVRNCPLAKFGYVPQSAALDPQFPLSVLEIVEMGAYGRVKSFQIFPVHETKRALEVLEQVGMAHVKGRSFFALSGGQKQRVLIARALMVGPAIMILDEPLSGVDPVGGRPRRVGDRQREPLADPLRALVVVSVRVVEPGERLAEKPAEPVGCFVDLALLLALVELRQRRMADRVTGDRVATAADRHRCQVGTPFHRRAAPEACS